MHKSMAFSPQDNEFCSESLAPWTNDPFEKSLGFVVRHYTKALLKPL
jgi:hypothetical protein